MRLGLRTTLALTTAVLAGCGSPPVESNESTIATQATVADSGSSSFDPPTTDDTIGEESGPSTTCGNGILEGDEGCDHGDQNGVGACKSNCTLNFCGDGYKGPGETCDDGNQIDDDDCTNDCALPTCGNGAIDPGEQCDDGNDTPGDGCSPQCTEPVCGDMLLEEPEECDGTPSVDCAGFAPLMYDSGQLQCDRNCVLDVSGCGFCGDGIRQPAEVCDIGDLGGQTCASLGHFDGPLYCNAMCKFDDAACNDCGDNNIDAGEQCDGIDLGGASCTSLGHDSGTLGCSACTLNQNGCGDCSNNMIDGTEQCDGTDLGAATCITLGFDGGSLVCHGDCTIDDGGCCVGVTEACAVADDCCGPTTCGASNHCCWPMGTACTMGNQAQCCSTTCNPGTLMCT